MPYSYIAHAGAQSSDGNIVTTVAVDFTGADLIVLFVAHFDGATMTISDNQGNSYTPLTHADGSSLRGRLYYKRSPTVSGAMTFTAQDLGGASFPSINVLGFSGSVASPFDQESGVGSAFTTTQATGSITPTEDNELVVTGAGFGFEASPMLSVDGGFTITDNQPGATGQAYGGAIAYLIQTAAALANPTWTGSGNSAMMAVIASFKASSGPPPATITGRQKRFLGVFQ